MQMNMLCAKNVKRHGMSSSKWTTKDKITQYKGLINLYGRDKKIFDFDDKKQRIAMKQEMWKIRKEVSNLREVLDDVTFGGRQELRNALSEYRNLRLPYQKTPPPKLIEILNEKKIDSRKQLDRLHFKMKQKTEELVQLKLVYAEFADRIKYESRDQIPEEEKAQMITVCVQDAILKYQVAQHLMDTHERILMILKKDAIFFDALLATLQVDGANQGKCILKVTEIGQLATEYLDDKKAEYGILEKIVIASMKERDISLKDVNEQLLTLNNNVKYLIRRDSLIELDHEETSKYSAHEIQLQDSISAVMKILNMIKSTTIVAKIPEIFPRMQDQRKQKLRLEELVAKTTKDRNTLLNKSKHAEQMYCTLGHTMVSTTFWYKEKKSEILNNSQISADKLQTATCLIKTRGTLLISIKASLQQLAEILRLITVPTAGASTVSKKEVKKKVVVVTTDVPLPAKLVKPAHVEENAMKLIQLITAKLNILIKAAADQKLEQSNMDIAVDLFQQFVDGMIDKSHINKDGPKEEALFDYVAMDDPLVPSRVEIKRKCGELCAKNAKSEYEI